MSSRSKNQEPRRPRSLDDLMKLAEDAGGTRVASKRKTHVKYRLPNRRLVVFSSSPSDHRSVLNDYSALKKALATTTEEKANQP